MEAGRANAISTGAATTPESARVAEIAAAETGAAAAALPGPLTDESAALAADRGRKAAVEQSLPGSGAAANAGAAGAGAALMAKIDSETFLSLRTTPTVLDILVTVQSCKCSSRRSRRYSHGQD